MAKRKADITENSMAISISKDYSLSKGLDVTRKVRDSCVIGTEALDIGKSVAGALGQHNIQNKENWRYLFRLRAR